MRQALSPDCELHDAAAADRASRHHASASLPTPSNPDQVVYEVSAPFPDELGSNRAATRADLCCGNLLEIPDQFWSQSAAGAPQRLVTVTLSDPFTYRAQTLETIVGVMGIARDASR